jgi:hypothetical protein
LADFIANEEIGCPLKNYIESHQYKTEIHPDCPLIEIDDDLIRMLKESTIVIKAVYDRLKKTISESDELKKELIGKNADLIIIDEANAIQDVESVGDRRNDE